MADYISRETAKDFFLNMDAGSRNPCSTLLTPEEFAEYLDEIPAANVKPVRHGEWIPISDGEDAECSECGEYYDVEGCYNIESFKLFCLFYRFCPNCGAKMDLEDAK